MLNNDVTDKIFWEKERLLKWDDFKGTPDKSKELATAESGVGIDEDHELEHIKTRYKRKFRFKRFIVKACFVPSKSWIKNERILEADQGIILKHEQGHFDICEKYSQKLHDMLNRELLVKSYSVTGNSEEEIKKNAEKLGENLVSPIMDKVKREWQEEQTRYEDETKNGRNLETQKQYDVRFDAMRD